MATLKTLTVRELINVLEQYEDDDRIVFASNYGDRANTQQAHPVHGHVNEARLERTGYSDSGFAVVDLDFQDNEDEDVFLVLR